MFNKSWNKNHVLCPVMVSESDEMRWGWIYESVIGLGPRDARFSTLN